MQRQAVSRATIVGTSAVYTCGLLHKGHGRVQINDRWLRFVHLEEFGLARLRRAGTWGTIFRRRLMRLRRRLSEGCWSGRSTISCGWSWLLGKVRIGTGLWRKRKSSGRLMVF